MLCSPQCQLPLAPVAGWLYDGAQGAAVAPVTVAPAVHAGLARTVRRPPRPMSTLTQILSKNILNIYFILWYNPAYNPDNLPFVRMAELEEEVNIKRKGELLLSSYCE